MEYYVILDDVNHKCFIKYNIFNNLHVHEDVKELRKQYKKGKLTRERLIEQLDRTFRYAFWSKCEYEFIISPWVGREKKEEKIDVYYQLKENIPLIADGLIREWKNFFKTSA